MKSLLSALARAMNLVNSEMEHHHEQTAYLANFIAQSMGLSEEDKLLVLYSALLHDIGSVVYEVPQSVSEIESNAREVSMAGAGILADLPGFHDVAQAISFCQCSWSETVVCAAEEGAICERMGNIASIVHLADMVSLAVDPNERVLNQVKRICEAVRNESGREFSPAAVDAFLQLSDVEFVWMDLMLNPSLYLYFTGDLGSVSLERAVQYTNFMTRIIDYRSSFTAMHSAGVAASAHELARLAGLCDADVMQMEIAGNLHDVGKLMVPREILEKPGRLTETEFNIVKEHPYYTAWVLLEVDGFDKIGRWASRHHEKLNGRGYPFHNTGDDLGCGERIMAVADIFSAITEERPYRAGMDREKAASVLMDDVKAGALCNDLVTLLIENYDQVDAARDAASHTAGKRYFDSLGK